MAKNLGKQPQKFDDHVDGDADEGSTNNNEEYNKLMKQLEEEFENKVRELLRSLKPLSELEAEKQNKLLAKVRVLLSSSSTKLPPPVALYELMRGQYQELQEYLVAAFFRAHILPYLNDLDGVDLDLDVDVFKPDWGLQGGEGFKIKANESALRLPPARPSPVPLGQQEPKLPERPFPIQQSPQTQRFMPSHRPGVDDDPSLAQPFPSHSQVPSGTFPFQTPQTPPTFPFQLPPQVPPNAFMPIGGFGFDGFPTGQFPLTAVPGDEGLALPPPPTLEEEFIARVYEVLLAKLPHNTPPQEVEELILTRLRQSPNFPPPRMLRKLLNKGPIELELYLIDTFIEAYILPTRDRLPKIRLNHPYSELERAALAGNWEDAKRFLENQPDHGKEAVAAWVTPYKMTALHVAAFKGHARFVKEMVEFVSKVDIAVLAKKDDRGFTVLDYVALNGRREVAEAITAKNPDLLNSSVSEELKPSALSIAVLGTCFRNKSDNTRVLRYLASAATDQNLLSEDLVNALILNGHLDILLSLLCRFPKYLEDTSNAASILKILAQTPSNFFSGSDLGFWERSIYPYIPVDQGSYTPSNSMGAKNRVNWLRKLVINIFSRITPNFINKIRVSKQKHLCGVAIVELVWEQILKKDNGVEECFRKEPSILVVAIKTGIIEILRTTFRRCPELVWIRLRCFLQRNSFLGATIKYRQEEVFKFLMEDKTCFITESLYTGTSMLHRAAKLPPYAELSSFSSAAFQMQREMQWFKAIEQFVPPIFRYKRENGQTAAELFDTEHKELAAAGETWMKDTSNYCMIVSTLITTVVFASAFTVPGGNTPEGLPIFLWSEAFLVFAVSNALALFASLMSVLMFLSILTARFTAEDFLKSLPTRMILGLASLFFAIATMIIAFGAALAIVLERRLEWVYIPIVLLAALPVSIFGLLELPLFIQMVKSTYRSTLSTSKTWD